MCAKEVKNKNSPQSANIDAESKKPTKAGSEAKAGKAQKSEVNMAKGNVPEVKTSSTDKPEAKSSTPTDKDNQPTDKTSSKFSPAAKSEKTSAEKYTLSALSRNENKESDIALEIEEDSATTEVEEEKTAQESQKNDQQSFLKSPQDTMQRDSDSEPHLQSDAKDAETESDPVKPSATKAALSADVDRDVSTSKGNKDDKNARARRHRRVWLWWLICLLVMILAGVAIYLCLVQPWSQAPDTSDQPDATTQPTEDNSNAQNPEGSSQPDEPKPEEKPQAPEEPKPDLKPNTEPPKSNQGDQLPPIAQRPGATDYPDVNTGSKLIALTFDDGPSRSTTPRLLDILNNRQTKATFFVLGNMAQAAPEIVRREAAEGHEVASHTPYHHQLTKLSAEQVRAEALEMDRIFTDILGTVPPFTRPPYGSWNATVGTALGQPMILWSIDPRDWADRNANTVCSRVTSAAFDGAIILVHDIHPTTVDAVPCIIDNLRARGYQFLTVSELAAARDVPLVSGTTYGSF